jgi:phage terminase Nu1 subunit (DNA packaging protein)
MPEAQASALPAELAADAMARLMNIGARRLQNAGRDGIVPKARHGRYPLAETIRAYCAYLQERANAGDGGSDSLSKQRARLTKNRADIAEMERARLVRELVLDNEMIAANTAIMTTVRTRMLAVASKYAPRLVMVRNANEVESILRPGIEEGLEELSRLEVALASVPSSGRDRGRKGNARDASPTAEADGLDLG